MDTKIKSEKPLCQALKSDGKRCTVAALPGSEYCFFHDPTKKEERHAAQSMGGSQNRMKTLGPEAPDLKVKDARDVVNLMSETINQVRKGQLDPRIANAVGYLATIMIKASERNNLEARLEELEAIVKAKKKQLQEAPMGEGGKL
jgi:hypothetical protein